MDNNTKVDDNKKNKSKFEDLRRKYTYNVKSLFPTMAANYNKEEIDRKINDIKKELEEELALSIKLDNGVEERMQEAKDFMDSNSNIIDSQFDDLCDLEQQLYDIMDENNRRKELDAEYNNLMKSQKYVDLGLKMRKMKDKIKSINNFLLKETQREPMD